MGSGNIKKFELKLGRTGLIIVICGMAVLLCLSFILGVGVGKNMDTYPEKISSMPQQLLAFFWRPARIESGSKSLEIKQAKPDKGNMDLTFHSSLTNDRMAPVQQPPVSERQDNVVVTNQEAKPEMPPAVMPERKDAVLPRQEISRKQTVDNEKPPLEAKSKTIETPVSVNEAETLFLIHVASLKDKTKANQIQKTIVALGYQAKVTKADIKGKGTWYRVISTGFKSKALAQSAADKISKKVKANCIIRPDTQDAG